MPSSESFAPEKLTCPIYNRVQGGEGGREEKKISVTRSSQGGSKGLREGPKEEFRESGTFRFTHTRTCTQGILAKTYLVLGKLIQNFLVNFQ